MVEVVTHPVVIFHVDGTPQPQGNKSAFAINGKDGKTRAVVREGGSGDAHDRHKSWRAAVTDAARAWMGEHSDFVTITGPVEVRVTFTFLAPQSDPYRSRHTVKPDKDKLLRSVLDSLAQAGVIKNDSQAFSLGVEAWYAERPGAEVIVMDRSASEAEDRRVLKDQARSRRSVGAL